MRCFLYVIVFVMVLVLFPENAISQRPNQELDDLICNPSVSSPKTERDVWLGRRRQAHAQGTQRTFGLSLPAASIIIQGLADFLIKRAEEELQWYATNKLAKHLCPEDIGAKHYLVSTCLLLKSEDGPSGLRNQRFSALFVASLEEDLLRLPWSIAKQHNLAGDTKPIEASLYFLLRTVSELQTHVDTASISESMFEVALDWNPGDPKSQKLRCGMLTGANLVLAAQNGALNPYELVSENGLTKLCHIMLGTENDDCPLMAQDEGQSQKETDDKCKPALDTNSECTAEEKSAWQKRVKELQDKLEKDNKIRQELKNYNSSIRQLLVTTQALAEVHSAWQLATEVEVRATLAQSIVHHAVNLIFDSGKIASIVSGGKSATDKPTCLNDWFKPEIQATVETLILASARRDYARMVAALSQVVHTHIAGESALNEWIPARGPLNAAVALASAKSPEDVSKILHDMVAPASSWRAKRDGKFHASISGLIGGVMGREMLRLPSDMSPLSPGITGLHASIGLDLTFWGSARGTFGAYLTPIDLGALATIPFAPDRVGPDPMEPPAGESDEAEANVDLDPWTILSPGAFLRVGLGDSPLVIGIGMSYVPRARRIVSAEDGRDLGHVDAVRLLGLLAVDTTLWL